MISVPWGQIFQIFTVTGKPVDSREVSGIRQRFVQSPETTYETFGVLCNGFGEVTTLWGNCTDNRNRTFCSIEILHHAGSFVESRKFGCQISRETFFSRHFFQTSGKFTKSFCPTGSRVCHDGYVITHVTIIFCQRNTGINRCFTSRYRHVGSVGDESGTVHHKVAGLGVDQFAEVFQYLSHFVSTLTTADIDNDIRIRPFGNLVLCHCFSCTKTARNSSCTAFGNREQGV